MAFALSLSRVIMHMMMKNAHGTNVLCGVIHHPFCWMPHLRTSPSPKRKRKRKNGERELLQTRGYLSSIQRKNLTPYMLVIASFEMTWGGGGVIDFGIILTRNNNLPYAYYFRVFFVG